ncbi:MAG: TRAP transporter small permease [Aliihoeflea sp.]|uniref:TRAP transporter small permease n=1 Tax=Aliihoeflea sp. 40Bstr573 TaxID=2696467 RepID=UPI0020949212|nr:TRAP transporter small permease [Aliihoeflea sp. 40Bstr573]MCO6385543.1 TRAP transporter small permease subunit [Aliihoeflea sp. 40Bstr573]
MTEGQGLLRRVVQLVDGAAAVFLAVITLLTFAAVVMRYVLQMPFPGSFDVSRLLLGVAIFWGIAAAAYRKDHIQVDLFWQILPPAGRRVLDVFSDIVFAIFIAAMAWMLFWQVGRVRQSGQTTFELAIPIWPFYGIAWLGIGLCLLVLIARILRGFTTPVSDPAGSQ